MGRRNQRIDFLPLAVSYTLIVILRGFASANPWPGCRRGDSAFLLRKPAEIEVKILSGR
jgi:hypothetical protein